MIQDRTSVFPKVFTELTFGLSDVLKVAPFTFYQVYEIFGVARYGVCDFSSFVGCEKSMVGLTLSKKRTGEAAWVVAFFNSCRLYVGRKNFRTAVSNGLGSTSRSRRLAFRL